MRKYFKCGMMKTEYQVVYGDGEDVYTFKTLEEAEKEFDVNVEATELRMVKWHGKEERETNREDISIKTRELT